MARSTKYIVITGGVLSGLGKGVVSASVGHLLSRKYRIVAIKCDGYLNVDPGTMNPIEHGEVFVLDDGGEVDLDFGHYERFITMTCKKDWSLTSGRIFSILMEKERRGDFLGKTVQVIPHVTGEIRGQFKRIAKEEKADVVLIEIGGTVGDIENLWFLEACRELVNDVGRDHVMFMHLGLVPVIDAQGQQKSKPLQQSISILREQGIFPDVIIGRSKEKLSKEIKKKLGLRANVGIDAVISDPDCGTVYELPLHFAEEGLPRIIRRRLGLRKFADLKTWRKLVERIKYPKQEITIAVCGKYTDLADSYISISEALSHCGAQFDTRVHVRFIETTDVASMAQAGQRLRGVDGIIVPGGFGSRGTEGKILLIRHARKHGLPFLGICYGLQLAVIEFARDVCGLKGANSTEIDPKTPHPVVDILPEQRAITDKGGTMRLGAYPALLKKGSKVAGLYNALEASERHRHRYEVNPEYHDALKKGGLVFSGLSPSKTLVEFIELPKHPYFVATQAHPELKSNLECPAPLFLGLVKASLTNAGAKKSSR